MPWRACSICNGRGFTTYKSGYGDHRGRYTNYTKPCSDCNGTGRIWEDAPSRSSSKATTQTSTSEGKKPSGCVVFIGLVLSVLFWLFVCGGLLGGCS
jgi:DnaJ-class molecular chaperone